MPVELPVEEAQVVPEGKHKGEITKVELREVTLRSGEQTRYVDIYLQDEDNELLLKWGAHAKITPLTKLGKTLRNFTDLEQLSGQNIDLEEILVGQRVEYMTMNEATDRGTFANIVDGSIKPAKTGKPGQKNL